MKRLLIALFFISLCTVDSIAQSYNNNQRIFNVKNFGATGNGTTDDTQAIQAAIIACDAAGGGIVWFPNGTYNIGGALQTSIGGLNMNAQLYFPNHGISDSLRSHIILKGETPPNLTQITALALVQPAKRGVILKSTLASGGATGAAVLGTMGNPSGFGTNTNYTYLTVENVLITVKNNPSGTGPIIGGISWKNGASLFTNKVAVVVDTAASLSTLPSNDVTGIELPDNSSETMSNIQNTISSGFRQGFKSGEHVVFNQAQAFCCYYSLYFKNGHHATSSLRFGSYWSAYDIYVAGFCTLSNFQIDTEWRQAGKWYDNVNTIKDSANLAKGAVFYTIIAAAVGKDNTKFSKSGGTNLNNYTNDQALQIKLVDTIGLYNTTATAFTSIKQVTNLGSSVFNSYGSTYSAVGQGFAGSSLLSSAGNLILTASGGSLTGGTNNITFRPSGYGSAAEAMKIASNGNVAIGTTTDTLTGRLIVNGGGVVVTTATATTGFKATSSLASSSASLDLVNSSGDFGYLRSYGSSFTVTDFQRQVGLGSDKGVLIFANGNSTSGGTDIISLRAGGYPANQERLRASSSGIAVGTQANATSVLQTTSFGTAYRGISALRTLDATDHTIDCTANTFTVTLPTAVGITGREYIISNSGSGVITIGTTSSQTFLNVLATPTTLTVAQFTNYKVISNGTQWLAFKMVN